MLPMERRELERYLRQLLDVDAISDYCPNGLQVEGRPMIRRIVCGVTACQALVEAAERLNADAVLVHHGYFWKGEDARLVGMKARRVGFLLRHDINLFAYHLPLDVHPELGNNAQLAARLGIAVTGTIEMGMRPSVVMRGELPEPMSLNEFSRRVADSLSTEPVVVPGGDHPVRQVAWCTGGGQRFIDQAALAGVDAYISGEISEPTTHSAREQGIHYLGAGHHATERYGVQALGEHLAQGFGIECEYVDIPNPA